MDKFKKIKSKLFKSKPPEKPLSVPLRSSYETDDFVPYIPPGSIDYIDIKPEERYPEWYQYKGDPDDFTRPYFPRRPYVEKKIVDQFPAPPTGIPEKPLFPAADATPKRPTPKRPSVRPPTMDFSFSDLSTQHLPPQNLPPKNLPPKRPSVRPPTLDFSQFPDEVLLHQFPQESKAKVDAFDAAEAARNAARLRARHRTPSSVSAQTQPLNIRRRGMSGPNAPAQPSGGMYRNHTASQSTYTLDPRVRSRACHPNGDAAIQNTSKSGSNMYSNSNAARSAYHLSPNARHPTSDSSHAVPSLPQQQAHETRSASVSRRNASSASSRSAHAMRRYGMLPPPEGSQHHEVLRILRGPHAVKLQTPSVHTRTNEDIDLPVNDTNSSKEWGAKSSRVVGGVATVAGYGRSAGVKRH